MTEFRSLATAFAKIDKDGNGSVDFNELALVLVELGKYQSHRQVHAMIEEMDEDGNGTIELREMMEYFKTHTNIRAKTDLERDVDALVGRVCDDEDNDASLVDCDAVADMLRSVGLEDIHPADLLGDGKVTASSLKEFMKGSDGGSLGSSRSSSASSSRPTGKR